jgi:putative chitinase
MLQLYYDKLESVIEEKVWIEAFKLFFDKYKINTLKRVAAFVSQASYESLEFRCVEENLNYSRNNLMILFPAHFNNQVIAEAYMHKENSIANRIYAYRFGNGSEESGDGSRYKGRGLLHITGKDSYRKFAEHAGFGIEDVLDYIITPQGAVHSACWVWMIKDLNAYADAEDMIGMTKRITGGVINAAKRTELYEEMRDKLK